MHSHLSQVVSLPESLHEHLGDPFALLDLVSIRKRDLSVPLLPADTVWYATSQELPQQTDILAFWVGRFEKYDWGTCTRQRVDSEDDRWIRVP